MKNTTTPSSGFSGTSLSGKVTSDKDLDALYSAPVPRALTKEQARLIPPYKAFIEKAPFVVLATSGPEGLDTSPRGDPPGFVRILDDSTLALPDRRGNNRIDSLRNIVHDPRVALLFILPGINETLRVMGRGEIVTDPDLCASFEMEGKLPVTVLIIRIESVFYQCPKAFVRSRLWDPESRIARAELPSNGEINKYIDPEFDAGSYDRDYPEHLKRTIY